MIENSRKTFEHGETIVVVRGVVADGLASDEDVDKTCVLDGEISLPTLEPRHV